MKPYVVPPAKVEVARNARDASGFRLLMPPSPALIATFAGQLGIPYRYGCALIEHESGGRNAWGGADGPEATFSGCPLPVTRDGYDLFFWLVVDRGRTSNGVGPAQITWRGFHADARARGYEIWRSADNIAYGLEHILLPALADSEDRGEGWWGAFRRYNGSGPRAEEYADRVMARADAWGEWFREAS